jgi:hypothetical protein
MNSVNPTSSSVVSAINSGLSTISAGTQRLDQDAQQIANPDQNATAPLVDLGQASIEAQAGADVIRTSNQMLGSLFNAFA